MTKIITLTLIIIFFLILQIILLYGNANKNKEINKETNIETNTETDIRSEQNAKEEKDIESYKEKEKEAELEKNKETELEKDKITDAKKNKETDLEKIKDFIQETNKEADLKTNKLTDLENKKEDLETNKITNLETYKEIDSETNKETNIKTNKETDLKTNKETYLEISQNINRITDLETNKETDTALETNQITYLEESQETNKETVLETDLETDSLQCQFNMTCVYFRDEHNNYIKYKKGTYIYSSTSLPLSLHLEFKDEDLNKMNIGIGENRIIVDNAYMHGNRMRPLKWGVTESINSYYIYIDLDESNKEIFEHLTSRIYDFTFKVKKGDEESIINLKVNHIDTSTEIYKSLEVSDWIESKNDIILYSYANVKTQVGYYFNHDDEIHALGDKGGFNPEQVMEIEIYDILKILVKVKRSDSKIDKTMINFGKATPKKVYNSRSHDGECSIEDFKYQIPVMYGVDPLKDSNNNTIYVTVYIGLKGDANLDKVVSIKDLMPVIVPGLKDCYLPRKNEICFRTDDIGINSLSNFLMDVTEDEYGIYNWNKTERTIDEEDGKIIYYFIEEKKNNIGISDNDIWNKVIGAKRFGG